MRETAQKRCCWFQEKLCKNADFEQTDQLFHCFLCRTTQRRSLDVSLAFRYFGDRTNAVIEPEYNYNTWTAQIQYRWRTNNAFQKKEYTTGKTYCQCLFGILDRGQRTNTAIGWYGKIFISPILPLLEPGYRCNTNTEQIQHTNRTNTLQKKNKYCDWLVCGDFH